MTKQLRKITLFGVMQVKAPRYYHATGNGVPYGPSLPGEPLAAYKARVRGAYGDLRGVRFGTQDEFHPIHFAR